MSLYVCSRHEIAQSLACTKNIMVERRQEDNHVTLNHPHVVLYLVQYMTNWYEAVVHYSIFLGWIAVRFDFYFRFKDCRGKAPERGCICTLSGFHQPPNTHFLLSATWDKTKFRDIWKTKFLSWENWRIRGLLNPNLSDLSTVISLFSLWSRFRNVFWAISFAFS